MALAQTQFQDFHNKIKMSYEKNLELREKRDMLIHDLKKSLLHKTPTWNSFDQGSYDLKTGIRPYDNNYDIDVGVNFDCAPSEYNDPVQLKIMVRDALNRSNRTVEIRRSCVTVFYMKDEKPEYHVDLALYCNDIQGMYLARGKEHSATEHRTWDPSEPRELSDYIKNSHKDEAGTQFRRLVRYLKRWREEKLNHGNLPGIALTIAAVNWIETNFNPVSSTPQDIYTIRDLVQRLIDSWSGNRLSIYLPVAPNNDLMERLTDNQMEDLLEQLKILKSALRDAIDEPDLHESCKILREQFGKDFPIPDKIHTTKKTSASVISTGNSA